MIDSARRNGYQLESPGVQAGLEHVRSEELRNALRTVGHLLKDEFFGLAAQPCPAGTSQLGLEILLTSESLGVGIERCSRLYGLVTKGVETTLSEEDGRAVIAIHVWDGGRDRRHFLPEWFALRWHKTCEWSIDETIPLMAVEFAHAPQDSASDYARLFGVPCRFNQPANRLVFSSQYLARRIVRRMEELDVGFPSWDPQAPERPDLEATWRDGLKAILKRRLARSATLPTFDQLAKDFGICSQTLRRRLRAENSSYRLLKAEARLEIAQEAMRDDRLTLTQIAALAGFAEPAGLMRAIKAWTGLSASQYRLAISCATPSSSGPPAEA